MISAVQVNVEHLAEIIHCRRMLHLGLFLSNYLLNAKLPERMLKKIEFDPAIKKLAAPIVKTLFVLSLTTAPAGMGNKT